MPQLTLHSGNIPRHQRETAGRQHLRIGPSCSGVIILRHLAIYTALSLAFVGALPAEAQTRTLRRNGEVLILNVRPRSYLDAGNVVPVGSMNYPASGYGQTVSYLNLPPYLGMRERFGAGVLPDPVTNSPMIGARNPFGALGY